MDNNWSPMFYNPENQENGQKKHLFSNRVNAYDNHSSPDSYYTGENANSYLPQRTSKLWNHINTRPYSLNSQQSSHISKERLEEVSQLEPFNEYGQKAGGDERAHFTLLEDKAEGFSDIFSEADDTSMLNKLQNLTFRTPQGSQENKHLKIFDQPSVQPSQPSFGPDPVYEEEPKDQPVEYPNHEYNEDNVYNEVKYDDKGYVESTFTENKFDDTEYKPSNMFNVVSAANLADLTSVTTSDTVKPQPLSTLAPLKGSPDSFKPRPVEKQVMASSGLTSTVSADAGNPFDTQNGFPKDATPKSDHRRETRLMNLTNHLNKEAELGRKARAYNAFAKTTSTDIVNYSNYLDYNPFSVFSVSKGAVSPNEGDIKKLRTVILNSTYSEDTLIKYFTEAICITNSDMMRQIIMFMVDLIGENHKIRQFVVRLMLCALSFHPEEFIGAFRVEYLNVLFTPQIDDTVGVYFLKLLLSYKSTFNSRTEVNNVPVAVDILGQLVYPHYPEGAGSKDRDHRDGKIETLYVLKILLERQKVMSVFELTNSILREQLCTIWHEMPKTIPNVNMVEVLLHWANSNEDVETKKYPFLLLERIRDTYAFPKGNTLLMSQFFIFALKKKAKIHKDLEFVITLVCGSQGDQMGSVNRGYRREGKKRINYKTESGRSAYLDQERDEDVLELVLYKILGNFNERDMLDLWCLLCVVPWKVTSPNSPFSRLFKTTLNTILNITSLNYDGYSTPNANNKIRLDILENCLRICLVRCSCPVNSLNSLLQTSLLLNPTRDEVGRPEQTGENIVACLNRNGMILNSLCNFLWKCHFLWTRIKDGVNMEVVIVVTELYKILASYTTAKPLDDNHSYKATGDSTEMYKFFKNSTDNGLWAKITTFIPQIKLNQYFARDGSSPVYTNNDNYMYNNQEPYYQERGTYEPSDSYKGEPRDRPSDIDFGESRMGMPRVVGLKNLGNSCYLNSLLQSLFHTRLFVYNLMQFQEKNKNEMVSSLARLFKKMKMTDKRVVSPKQVFKLVSENMDKSQQDVTEAIRFISEAIDANLELWKSVFAGLVVRRIECLRCHALSDNEETMYDFSLSLKKAKTVQQMLDNFCNVETLTGENKYFCLKCNKEVKANMWNVIASPPSHLIVILNRNMWNLNEANKVLKRVKIDSEVFVSGFQYRLYGSIIHSGGSTESGHYYFIGCDSEGLTDWHKVDDSVVSVSHEREVDDISRDSSNTHVPYVLLYRCLLAPPTPLF